MASLNGDDGNDEISGGKSHDVISGHGGGDSLFGGGGNDKLFGGEGDDHLEGGAGRDMLKGGEGNDTLYGDSPEIDALGANGGSFGLFAFNSSGHGLYAHEGFYTGLSSFDGKADSVQISVEDDETRFEDFHPGGHSPTDQGSGQYLSAEVTISVYKGYNPLRLCHEFEPVTFPAGTQIHAIAQSNITNISTGECGNAWVIRLGDNPDHLFYSYDIPVKDGDVLSWVSSNTPFIQSPTFADVSCLEYDDLVQTNGRHANHNDSLQGEGGG